MGTITWISLEREPPRKCLTHLAAPGFLYSEEEHPVDIPAGKVIRGPIDHVILHAYEKKIRFAEVVAAVQTLVGLLETHLKQQFAGLPTGGSDLYARAEYTPNEAPHPVLDGSEQNG